MLWTLDETIKVSNLRRDDVVPGSHPPSSHTETLPPYLPSPFISRYCLHIVLVCQRIYVRLCVMIASGAKSKQAVCLCTYDLCMYDICDVCHIIGKTCYIHMNMSTPLSVSLALYLSIYLSMQAHGACKAVSMRGM